MNKTCYTIFVRNAFSAMFISLALGALASLAFGIEPDAVLAAVVTAASFTVMMALAVNTAYKVGQKQAGAETMPGN